MRTRDAILVGIGAVMSLLIVVFAVRIAGHYEAALPLGRMELGRVKMTRLTPETQQALAALQHDVLITYYVSSRERMPSDMRRIEREVTDLLQAMQRASGGRFDYQVIDPDGDLQFIRQAAHHRVAPYRVRSIARDSWSERTVWSTLHIAYGPHEPAVINGVSPAYMPMLQSLIVNQIHQKDHPTGSVYGIAGRPKYRLLEQWLSRSGTVMHVDLDGGEAIPDEVDVLFWMEPQRDDADAVRMVQQFLDSGRSAIIAGSRHAVVQEGGIPVELGPTDYDPEFLLASFGLRPVDGMVLDGHCHEVPGEMAPVPARFLVRCIPQNQDFRVMGELPNGHLLFGAPTPLIFNGEALTERGLNATVLASTSDRTQLGEVVHGDIDLTLAVYHEGQPVPKLPLMVWLQSYEPWRGSLVVSASASLFQDEWFEADGFAHRRLVDVLTHALASDERLVIHRAGIAQIAQALPPLAARGRLAWRIACIVIFPALLAVIAWRRGSFLFYARLADAQRLPVWGVGIVIAGTLAIVGGVALLPIWRVDLTAGRTNQLAPASRAIASQVIDDAAVKATLIMSRQQQLPPEMRPMLRRIRAAIAEFQRAGADLRLQRLIPEDLDGAQLRALEADGVRPLRYTTRDEDLTIVRTAYASLRLEGNGRVELLHFPDRASLEHLEFRIAFALWRLRSGRQAHIAFASDVPRLSAAEAYHDFQQRSLLAPMGSDVYSLARSTLEQADFRVTHVNPWAPEMPEDVDLIVWMQPRRNVLPMLEVVVEHLHRGVPVMIAAQHYNMQARQYRGAGFKTVYWPQPQIVDLHLHYFPDIGIQLVQEVVFDELHGQMDLQTQVNRDHDQRDYETQASALPFLIRASAANYAAEHPITRNLGDQLMPFAAYWNIDTQRLSAHGIIATPLLKTSQRSWTYNWTGGWIPDDLLTGPARDEHNQPAWQSHLPLGVLLEGMFPQPIERLTSRRANTDEPVELDGGIGLPARLFLLSCSEMFKNERLRSGDYHADHLLLNAVAYLALDEDLATVAAHRRVAPGLDYVSADARLRWRGFVVAAGPLVMLLFALTWRTARALGSGRRAAA